MTITPDLMKLVKIAQAAGDTIMGIYKTDFVIVSKLDRSPVTEADQQAETLILAHLAKEWPQTPVIAEENASRGNVPVVGKSFFLVDPLDGTREFAARNGQFTVNIALIENGVPVMGVIYAPALDQMYCGDVTSGAHKSSMRPEDDVVESTWNPIRVAPSRPEGPIAIASRSHRDDQTEAYIAAAKPSAIKNVGSSLKFCAIAEGSADIYPRYGRTMEWDTAAGQAILEAAGGLVRDAAGNRLTYGKVQAGYANPAFFASAL